MIEADTPDGPLTYDDLSETTKTRLRPLGRTFFRHAPTTTFDVCPATSTDTASASRWEYIDIHGTVSLPPHGEGLTRSRVRITPDWTLDFARIILPAPTQHPGDSTPVDAVYTFQKQVLADVNYGDRTPVLSVNDCAEGCYPICTFWPPEKEVLADGPIVVNADTTVADALSPAGSDEEASQLTVDGARQLVESLISLYHDQFTATGHA